MSAAEIIVDAELPDMSVVVYRSLDEARELLPTETYTPAGIMHEIINKATVATINADEVLTRARALVVADDASFSAGLAIVATAKVAGKDAEADRTSYTKIINPVLDRINDLFRGPKNAAKEAEVLAWTACQAYEREQKRLAEEAARKLREEQERIERRLLEEAAVRRRAEEDARLRQEQAFRDAEAARVAGDRVAQEIAEKAAKAAQAEAERNAAAAERREEKAEIAAAAPTYFPPSTTGARKAAGVSGRTLPTWEYDGPDEQACILRVAKAAATGNLAALRCLTINPSAALIQSKAGSVIDGLRFGTKSSAPTVRR